MNIFPLDLDPIIAARYNCNKHNVKIIIEITQMLFVNLSLMSHSRDYEIPYKVIYKNHPVTRWVRKTLGNWNWTIDHGLALCFEYTRRYGREHKCQKYLEDFKFKIPYEGSELGLTPFYQAIPEQFKIEGDPVQAYRCYYKGERISKFARWKGVKPLWINM